MGNNKSNKTDLKKLAIIGVAALTLIIIALIVKLPGKTGSSGASDLEAAAVTDSDIVIPVSEVTEKPSFYPAKINGTDMEVIAVKASDGTIRTVFNTCQVCYSSGKGYYEYENGKLVCQNCGNSFSMDDVEVTKGGCNPVPITDEYKTVTDDTITISKDVLVQAAQIFENWK